MVRPKLDFRSIFFLGVNTVIGSGIFLLPGKVHLLAGGWSLWLYAAITAIILSIAWCAAQCAALFNRNGGAYIYAKEAFGEFVGFEVGVMRWVVGMISWATLAVGLVTGLSTIWPQALEENVYRLLLFSLIGGLAALNWAGMRAFSSISQLIAMVKIVPLLFFICFGLYSMNIFKFEAALVSPFNFDGSTLGEGALAIFYAFGGFEGLTITAGEMKNPKKDLPIVLLVIILCCSLIYITIQTIAMGTLGVNLAESVTPISDVASALFGSWGKACVMGAMLLSMSGINLAASFITPRIATALAEDNLLPSALAKEGRFGTPTLAIAITTVFTLAIAFSGSFTQLVTITAVARFISYVAICCATLVFQNRSHTNYLKKPWRLFIPLFALSGIGLMLYSTPISVTLWCFGSLLIFVPLYILRKWQLRKQEMVQNLEISVLSE